MAGETSILDSAYNKAANTKWNYTISDIKEALGKGMSLRSNKYLLEIPVPGTLSKKVAILARGASFPEYNIGKVELWHKGRKYMIRGEKDIPGEITFNFIDSSEMVLRRCFEEWMADVDNSEPKGANALSGIFGNSYGSIGDIANTVISAINKARSAFSITSITQLSDLVIGKTHQAKYQSYINIWQLDQNGKSVFGYRLTNAFPTGMGATEFTDETENQLTEFSVTFTFSDLTPINGNASTREILSKLTGIKFNNLKESLT